MSTIKIIIADDHEVVIDGLVALLSFEPKIQIVGRALDGLSLLEILRHKPVDLVIMDIDMPGMNGVEATKQLKKDYPAIKILVLTMYNTPEFISNIIKNGADGYLLKNTRKKELLEAIYQIASGQTFYTPAVTKALVDNLRGNKNEIGGLAALTSREKEIIRHITKGLTSKEIGQRLFISPNTVERHRKNIFAKLDIKNVVGLVRFAIKNGLDAE